MTLKECPFCGNTDERYSAEGKIRLDPVMVIRGEKNIWCHSFIYYRVKCKHCGAEGGTGMTGYNVLTKTQVTEEQAMSVAIEKWNRRA